MTRKNKRQVIAEEYAKLSLQYPQPTEDQFEAAKQAVMAGELKLSDDTIRMALKCSINRDTKKFDIGRFWEVLPEFAEMELRQ